MTSSSTPQETLSPEEAFAVLGDETRIEILQVLGKSDTTMSFTALRNAVGLHQGGQFNYHLDKLVGHFVKKSDGGYALCQPGRRVVEAVLSGAVTHDPELEPTDVDFECLLCGGSIRVSYRSERVELYCTECSGQYGQHVEERDSSFDTSGGYLGGYRIPPAGVDGRSPYELLEASSIWSHLENVALANELCPRCGAVVDTAITVCENHDRSGGLDDRSGGLHDRSGGLDDRSGELCSTCDKRHAVQVDRFCENCQFTRTGMAINILATKLELRQFVAEQGIDPIVEGFKWGWDCIEDVRSIEPFRADFTFEIEEESITLHTGEGLAIHAVT